VDVNDDLPTEQDLKRVGDLVVLDSQGVSTPFKEVFGGQGKAKRQLVIFVRHFFCGVSYFLRILRSRVPCFGVGTGDVERPTSCYGVS
jgi:hypothetical protein